MKRICLPSSHVQAHLWKKLTIGLAAVLVVSFHNLTIRDFPAPFVDEIWYVARAWGYLQSGYPFGALDRGVVEQFEGYWTYYLRLPTMIHAAALRIAGQPELMPLRFVSLAFGVLLLVAVFFLGRSLGGSRLGLLSVFLTALSAPFLTSAHMARTDIMVAALCFSALMLYFSYPTHAGWLLIVGMLIGIAEEFHPNSVIFVPVIPLLMFIEHRWRLLKNKSFWSFVLGALLGGSVYIIWHILPYPQTYFAINRTVFSTHTPPLLTCDLRVISKAFVDFFLMLLYAYQPLFILILWSLVEAAMPHNPLRSKFLWATVVLMVGFTLMVRNKFLYYAILLTPALDILCADFILRFLQRKWQAGAKNYLQQTLVWGTLLGAIALNMSVIKFDFWSDYQNVLDKVRNVVRPDETVMGAQIYWTALSDNPYYSWEELAYYRNYKPEANWLDALYAYKPDIFILDYFLDVYLVSPEKTGDAYLDFHRLPRPEVDEFLATHAHRIAAFDGGYYGIIRVFRIHWDTYKP